MLVGAESAGGEAVIDPTDEMVQLALDVFLATPTDSIAQIDAGMRDALAAAFAIVVRDNAVEPYCLAESGVPGVRCGKRRNHVGVHYAFLPTGGMSW